MKGLKPIVFFPPVLLLLSSAIFSLIDLDAFLYTVKSAKDWIIQYFGWLFLWGTFSFLIVLVLAFFSPISKKRIGGPEAKPFLNRWQWFSITLCTTIATGILFWGIAEPVFHLHYGPPGVKNPQAFAMSTMFFHWTIIPYGIYTLAALVFAIGFYNYQKPFSVSTLLFPLFGERAFGWIGHLADIICLFALVSGMAASLGAGILTIAGGLDQFLGISPNRLVFGFIGLTIVGAFVASAISGLQKGIKWLSDINTRLFFALGVFVFISGPTLLILKLGIEGSLDQFLNFIPRSLGLDPSLDREWVGDWTIFNWANWLAWTPVTALFLGRIAYGYTVRAFIIFNLLLPSIFGGIWMMIFSGTTIGFDQMFGAELINSLDENGPQSLAYRVLDHLPFTEFVSFIFLLIVFISYVTAADSNTAAMTGMSTRGITPQNQEAPLGIKLIWGLLVGLISWIMISFAGIEGIKMISTLGGFPALFLVLLVGGGLVKLILQDRK